MAPVEEFESTLKDIVNAKRLSARKMNDLTAIALKSMKEDTQLVSTLYRTHKNLVPTAKIWSLYVFDALSRAARSQATKHPQSNDPRSTEGNCATFLLKVEGVLDGLFTDMVSLNHPDAKEKTQKILDIWIKGNTFPSALLSRLKDIVIKAEQGQKESEINLHPNVPSMNGVSQTPPPPIVAGAANGVPDPQATLLALLAQAAATSTNGGQIHPNTGNVVQQPLGQLALLQQLAQATAAGGDGTLGKPAAHVPPASTPTSRSVVPPMEPSRSPSAHREDYNLNRRPARYDNYDDSDRGHDFNDYHRNNYAGPAGPSRGSRGGYRGRGRGYDPRGGGGRWEDRGDRMRERERSPPRRPRRSRSRSPPSRYGGRRDARPYSPPRRPSHAIPNNEPQSRQTPNETEKDEFGRDIRPQSPASRSDSTSAPASASAQPITPVQTQHLPQSSETGNNNLSVESATSLNPNDQPTASKATEPPSETPAMAGDMTQPQMITLDQFDYTDPTSWEALGKQWELAYGYAPSTEQIMQYVMTGSMMANQMGGWPSDSWDSPSSAYGNGTGRGGRGRGGFNRGRGSYGRGNHRGIQGAMDADEMATDAIVLGENTVTPMVEGTIPEQHQVQREVESSGVGGKMQRVGGKWVFVRDMGTAAGS